MAHTVHDTFNPTAMFPDTSSPQILTLDTSVHLEVRHFRQTFVQPAGSQHNLLPVPWAPDHSLQLHSAPLRVHFFFRFYSSHNQGRINFPRGQDPIHKDTLRCLLFLENQVDSSPAPSSYRECSTRKIKGGKNLKQALGKQANKFDPLLLFPPLREIQYLYFPASEKIVEHDLSQESYRPAYYKTDVLRWQSAFLLRPQLPVTVAYFCLRRN